MVLYSKYASCTDITNIRPGKVFFWLLLLFDSFFFYVLRPDGKKVGEETKELFMTFLTINFLNIELFLAFFSSKNEGKVICTLHHNLVELTCRTNF